MDNRYLSFLSLLSNSLAVAQNTIGLLLLLAGSMSAMSANQLLHCSPTLPQHNDFQLNWDNSDACPPTIIRFESWEEIRLQYELVANGLCALGIGWLPNVLGHSFYGRKCSFIFLENFIITWFTKTNKIVTSRRDTIPEIWDQKIVRHRPDKCITSQSTRFMNDRMTVR